MFCGPFFAFVSDLLRHVVVVTFPTLVPFEERHNIPQISVVRRDRYITGHSPLFRQRSCLSIRTMVPAEEEKNRGGGTDCNHGWIMSEYHSGKIVLFSTSEFELINLAGTRERENGISGIETHTRMPRPSGDPGRERSERGGGEPTCETFPTSRCRRRRSHTCTRSASRVP